MLMTGSTPLNSTSPFDAGSAIGEEHLDAALRPKSFEQFVGQTRLLANIDLALRAARSREETLDHVLLSGLPGLGKTTLARLLATAMDAQVHETSGPALARPADLVGILTNLQQNDFLFIDEIHRLPRPVEEVLYSAMEDFVVDVVLDQGPAARSMRLSLPRFTLVGATTREGLLSAPFRARFGLQEKFELYSHRELASIVTRSAVALQVELDAKAADLIAERSRGTPRVANRFLRRVRDLAQEEYENRIDLDIAAEGLHRLGIDHHGLCSLDRRILEVLVRSQRAVGLKTIAVAIGEEERTIEDVYEPYLIRRGLVARTPQGRCASPTGEQLFVEHERATQEGRLF
jgi:Holliday junction DNA helicase RuvB